MSKSVISCPKCGYEYLLGEIFIPKFVIGQPNKVIRDDGKILSYKGIKTSNKESYICDRCGCDFLVSLNILTTVTSNDIQEEYVSKLFDKELQLSEK